MKNLKRFMEENEIETMMDAKCALEDGHFLSTVGLSQTQVENLHAEAAIHWETLIEGSYYDLNESEHSVMSSKESFNVVFESKEDAEKVKTWLELQGGEYVTDIQLTKIYDNDQISQSTGIEANYELHNYTE